MLSKEDSNQRDFVAVSYIAYCHAEVRNKLLFAAKCTWCQNVVKKGVLQPRIKAANERFVKQASVWLHPQEGLSMTWSDLSSALESNIKFRLSKYRLFFHILSTCCVFVKMASPCIVFVVYSSNQNRIIRHNVTEVIFCIFMTTLGISDALIVEMIAEFVKIFRILSSSYWKCESLFIVQCYVMEHV